MKRREFLAYTAPSTILTVALMIAPLVMTVYLSFHEFEYGSPLDWIGLDNYTEAFGSGALRSAAVFTLIYTVVTTAGKVVAGFALALLLNYTIRARSIFLGVLLVPLVVPPVVGALVFGWMFRGDVGVGLYDFLLSSMGIDVNWYADTWPARLMLAGQGIWQDVTFAALILLAGLQVMPREPLEAAYVDGARWLQRIRYIVIPELGGLFVFIAMMSVMDAFRVFDNIAVTTKGGPAGSTDSLMYLSYQVAFDQQRLGLGSAISMITVVVILVFLVPFLRHTSREIRGKR
ncbi:carbohydrate ABC transporter permease [Streptosporangium sp. NBC_01756]|uniref:carbohydrate ABC transporter permease n=1 Tax=Streptosporangium sp. NBC_01756 TaxID=2975950 RepID=UPI002DDA4122|nr:sugar ABC transporter permease [Streptosporangium sp. NBC_01756]WSC87954.1 sugar ABC transporter permease [Streptosporangium sp. NBC_01756]